MSNELVFWDTKIIWANNRLEKIHKFWEINVRGLKISVKNPWSVNIINWWIEIDYAHIGILEMLIYDWKKFKNHEWDIIDPDNYNLIAEWWELNNDKSKIIVFDEFIVHQT